MSKEPISFLAGNLRFVRRHRESTLYHYLHPNDAQHRRSLYLSLGSYAEVEMMGAWFLDHDLASMKLWSATCARCRYQYEKNADLEFGGNFLGGIVYDGLYYVVPDDEALAQQFFNWPVCYGLNGEGKKPKDVPLSRWHELYLAHNVQLAGRKEWAELERRCIAWLESPPKPMKRYVPDMQFLLALARGDMAEMERTIAFITTKLERSRRANMRSGTSDMLISEEAVLYAKLA